MAGRLGIDFGTSNTVVAVWDEARREGVPMHIAGYGRLCQTQTSEHGAESISIIPSLIHYGSGGERWLGNQVLEGNLYHSEHTFRWMKRFIAHRSPTLVRVGERDVSHAEAGRDFLSAIMNFARAEAGLEQEEVALSTPVEAFEHYQDWLTEVAAHSGLPRFRLIDEPSAAALGYGAHIQAGQVYLIFDFGGGTLDAAVVRIEDEPDIESGRRCRVLGKAGVDLGGATIDQWLFEEVLRRNGRSDADDEVRQVSRSLLVECEAAKERLSTNERAAVSVMNPRTGAVIAAEFTRGDLERVLDDRDALTRVDRTIRRAFNAARERGYTEDNVQSVLMVGGSSLIPAVQRTLQRIFGRERVRLDRPFDAVARGAAAFVAGVEFYDHIQHDYAVRYVNAQTGEYSYRVIVERGTPYPTPSPVARLTVKASYNQQSQLGIQIFEMGEHRHRESASPVELLFDPAGAARIVKVSPEQEERRISFWMNEQTPTFLRAAPPALRGEPRFEVEFLVDANKRLLVTARDVKTGHFTHREFPVVKLT